MKESDANQRLFDAVRWWNSKDAQKAIWDGADVNARGGNQRTPLHEAALKQGTDSTLWLIGKGADVNARDVNQSTPLHEAAGNGCADVARLLIKKGANINAKNDCQKTPLQLAVESRDQETVDVLQSAMSAQGAHAGRVTKRRGEEGGKEIV